jgi:hypothetical protein
VESSKKQIKRMNFIAMFKEMLAPDRQWNACRNTTAGADFY